MLQISTEKLHKKICKCGVFSDIILGLKYSVTNASNLILNIDADDYSWNNQISEYYQKWVENSITLMQPSNEGFNEASSKRCPRV